VAVDARTVVEPLAQQRPATLSTRPHRDGLAQPGLNPLSTPPKQAVQLFLEEEGRVADPPEGLY